MRRRKSSRSGLCRKRLDFLLTLSISLVIHRLTPLIPCLLARNFHRDMGEPAVCFCAVPVLHLCWNRDDHTRFKADRLLSFLLIPAAARRADQKLSAAALCMMNVPVVPAPRFKRDVCQKNRRLFRVCEGIQPGIADKILCKCRVLLSHSKYILSVKLLFVIDFRSNLSFSIFLYSANPSLPNQSLTAFPGSDADELPI